MSKIAGAASRIFSRSLGLPAIGASDDVHAAVVDDGTEQTIATGITSPPTARTVTATAGGTAGDIGAIQVTVNGTNDDDEAISEVLPAFTVNTAGTVQGAKAFKTVTSFVVPAHDGLAATTEIGLGDKLGLGVALPRDTVIAAFLDGVREATRPTVAVDAANVEGNTIDLDSALDGSEVLVDFYEQP